MTSDQPDTSPNLGEVPASIQAGATPASITSMLSTVRQNLQQLGLDVATTPHTKPERQRLNEDLVTVRDALNQLVNVSNGGK